MQSQENICNFTSQRDIELAGRFIGDEQIWLTRDGLRNDNALTLASANLVRVRVGYSLRVVEAHFPKQIKYPFFPFFSLQGKVSSQDFFDLFPGLQDRVESEHRILRHAGDLASAQRTELCLG